MRLPLPFQTILFAGVFTVLIGQIQNDSAEHVCIMGGWDQFPVKLQRLAIYMIYIG